MKSSLKRPCKTCFRNLFLILNIYLLKNMSVCISTDLRWAGLSWKKVMSDIPVPLVWVIWGLNPNMMTVVGSFAYIA